MKDYSFIQYSTKTYFYAYIQFWISTDTSCSGILKLRTIDTYKQQNQSTCEYVNIYMYMCIYYRHVFSHRSTRMYALTVKRSHTHTPWSHCSGFRLIPARGIEPCCYVLLHVHVWVSYKDTCIFVYIYIQIYIQIYMCIYVHIYICIYI